MNKTQGAIHIAYRLTLQALNGLNLEKFVGVLWSDWLYSVMK